MDAPGDDAGAPLDPATLERLREFRGSELVFGLGEVVASDIPQRLASLSGAVEDGDAEAVKRIAHALTGSSANMGAARMAGICEELQKAGASKDLLERLRTEFEGVRQALVDEA